MTMRAASALRSRVGIVRDRRIALGRRASVIASRPGPALPAEKSASAGQGTEGMVLGSVGEPRPPDRRQPDPEPAEPLVDVIEDLPPGGRRRPERDADGHR